jgi:hypothetical protein
MHMAAAASTTSGSRTGLIVSIAVPAVVMAAAGMLGLGWWVWRRRHHRSSTEKLFSGSFSSSSEVLVVMRPQDTSNLADMPGLNKGVRDGMSRWLCVEVRDV